MDAFTLYLHSYTYTHEEQFFSFSFTFIFILLKKTNANKRKEKPKYKDFKCGKPKNTHWNLKVIPRNSIIPHSWCIVCAIPALCVPSNARQISFYFLWDLAHTLNTCNYYYFPPHLFISAAEEDPRQAATMTTATSNIRTNSRNLFYYKKIIKFWFFLLPFCILSFFASRFSVWFFVICVPTQSLVDDWIFPKTIRFSSLRRSSLRSGCASELSAFGIFCV